MSGPLRFYSDFLYPINNSPYPLAPIDNANMVLFGGGSGSFMGFPVWLNVYPLAIEFNSLVIEWTVVQMPSNATYIELVPFSFKGLVNTGQLVPAYIGEGVNQGNITTDQSTYTYDYLDQANNDAVVKRYYLRKTAADGVVGTTHFINIGSPYIGFYLLSDGDQNPNAGVHTLYAHLSHR